ncbi:glycosyltransferase [bacterium]|nr:glycosyltransferase [bacterium]
MRILYVTPAFQHPTVRGPHRHYHFIRCLSNRHEITLLTLLRSPVSREAMEEVQAYTERILTFDVSASAPSRVGRPVERLPFFGGKLAEKVRLVYGLRQMRSAFLNLASRKRYDVVLFHGKSVFEVIKGWSGVPLVVDFCDASSMRISSRIKVAQFTKIPFLWYRLFQMQRIERDLVAKTRHVAFISNRDRLAVMGPSSDHEIIPIGVDHEYWKRSDQTRTPNSIIFTGVMDYGPNHDSAMYLLSQIVPLVRQQVSDLKIVIAGRDPLPELVQKAAEVGGVEVTGFVDDMRDHLGQAQIFAAPMRFGSGIQNKVLEAMAMEVPVVTTTVVADGLQVKHAEPPVAVADSEESFASSIVHLLQDQTERSRLARASRRFVEDHFDWNRSAEKFESMCFDAVNDVIPSSSFESSEAVAL